MKNMILLPATKEQEEVVKKDIEYDEKVYNDKHKTVKEWYKKQPHLPELPDELLDKYIQSNLIGAKMSTEKAKNKLDTYFSMRHILPEIFLDKDPTKEDVRKSVDVFRYFPSKELTAEGIRIDYMCINPAKDKRFTTTDLLAYLRRVVMIADIRLQTDTFLGGEYIVVDASGFYLSQMSEVPWGTVVKYMTLIQAGIPMRIKGIFIYNAANYVEAALNIMKPAFKEKLRKRIHVFQGDHTNLYKYIPQKMLPKELGGEQPGLNESSQLWQDTIEAMKDFYVEDVKRVTDESKRPKDCKNDFTQIFGVNGTFSKLNID